MSDMKSSGIVEHAAARAADRRFYLASALAAFRELRGMDDAALAGYLGCSTDTLAKVQLCRRPNVDSAEFRHEVRLIADRFAFEPVNLLRLLREVASVEAMRGRQTGQSTGFLMAARDKPRRPRRTDRKREGD